MGVKPNILLRITPGIDPHTHQKIVTGNVDSKFGSAILTGQAFDIVKEALKCENIHLKGFHCHVGSQIFDIEPFSEAAEIMLAFIAKIKGDTGFAAEILNIGGGFGVRYTEEDPEIDYSENIRMLGERFDTICREAAFDAKRTFQIISRTRQADDHPVSLDFPEGLYLKGTVLRAM
jgi:diaminopimelate decarboxylase